MNPVRKSFVLIILFLVFLPFLGMTADKIGGSKGSFKAKLSGEGEVPPVKTNAEGEVTFQLNKEGDKLTYFITMRNIQDVTAVHIHQGGKGQNGPPIAPLLIEPKKPSIGGTLYSEGRIRAYELIGPLKRKPFSSLVQRIEAGDAYVNVHTVQHPEGEIRGQIQSINNDR